MIIAWVLLVDLVGSLVAGMDWLSRLTLFHYMALAPAQDPNLSTVIITLVISLLLCLIATALFRHRDVRTP